MPSSLVESFQSEVLPQAQINTAISKVSTFVFKLHGVTHEKIIGSKIISTTFVLACYTRHARKAYANVVTL